MSPSPQRVGSSSVVALVLLIAVTTAACKDPSPPHDVVTRGERARLNGGEGRSRDVPGARAPDTDPSEPAAVGQVKGVVQEVALSRGHLVLRTEHAFAVLSAKPMQLAGLRRGERLEVRFANYGGDHWLLDGLRGAAGTPRFGRTSNMTGWVGEVNEAEGTLALFIPGRGDVLLRAHPAEVQPLERGERVNVSAVRVGKALWVQGLRSLGHEGRR